MAEVTKRQVIGSAAWKMVEALSTKGVSLIVSVVLARLLLPEDYGVIALAGIFINLATFVVQGGLTTALVRKEDVDDVDYSNAFFFCMAVAAACYGVFFVAAPDIAAFYDEPLLTSVLRVQMLSLFLCALGAVRNAIITRQFRFQALCIANLVANIISGIAGIILAYKGFGVWALVFQTLIRDGACAVLLCFAVKWKLTFAVSFPRIKVLFSASSWILGASLLDFLGNNFSYMLYGKCYSTETLGYHTKGNQLPELVCLHTFGAISSVLLPTMVGFQSDRERLKLVTRKMVALSSFVIFPMMGGIAVVGKEAVSVLFTDKWLPCVPILWAASLYFAVNIFRQINSQLIYAVGKASTATRVEAIRFVVLLTCSFLGILVFRLNIYVMSFIAAGVNIFVVLMTQECARRLINYSYVEWVQDILPALLLTGGMGVVVHFVGMITLSDFPSLLLQISVGIMVYIALSWLCKVESFKEIVGVLKDLISRKSLQRNEG